MLHLVIFACCEFLRRLKLLCTNVFGSETKELVTEELVAIEDGKLETSRGHQTSARKRIVWMAGMLIGSGILFMISYHKSLLHMIFFGNILAYQYLHGKLFGGKDVSAGDCLARGFFSMLENYAKGDLGESIDMYRRHHNLIHDSIHFYTEEKVLILAPSIAYLKAKGADLTGGLIYGLQKLEDSSNDSLEIHSAPDMVKKDYELGGIKRTTEFSTVALSLKDENGLILLKFYFLCLDHRPLVNLMECDDIEVEEERYYDGLEKRIENNTFTKQRYHLLRFEGKLSKALAKYSGVKTM